MNINKGMDEIGDRDVLLEEGNNLFHLIPPCGNKNKYDYERSNVKKAIFRDFEPCKVCFGRIFETE